MVKTIFKLLVVGSFPGLLASCSYANNKPLLIKFSTDSSSIVLQNIAKAELLQLQNHSGSDSTFKSLVSVLQTPSEKEPALKELPVNGTIHVTDSNLVFIPTTPFVKGRDYLVITHLSAKYGDIERLLKNDLSNHLRPRQKLLTR